MRVTCEHLFSFVCFWKAHFPLQRHGRTMDASLDIAELQLLIVPANMVNLSMVGIRISGAPARSHIMKSYNNGLLTLE